jgi:hypothetical protein
MTRLVALAAVTALLASSGCELAATDPAVPGITATVTYLDVEGGCWALTTRSGKRYEPLHLPPAFRQDGLRVAVTLRQRPDVGSFCMVGQVVEVTSIRVR